MLRPRGRLPVQLPLGLGRQHLQHRSGARCTLNYTAVTLVIIACVLDVILLCYDPSRSVITGPLRGGHSQSVFTEDNDLLFLQLRTAHVTRARARMEGRASEEEMPSPASAKTAGRDPPVHRVRHHESLCHVHIVGDGWEMFIAAESSRHRTSPGSCAVKDPLSLSFNAMNGLFLCYLVLS